MAQYLMFYLILFSQLASADPKKHHESLSDFKWKNRIILINTEDKTDMYLDELRRVNTAIVDRDIIWFLINETKVISNYQGKLYNTIADEIRQTLDKRRSTVLLIGKDGSIKSTETELMLDELFSDIDNMPMRQQELQNR